MEYIINTERLVLRPLCISDAASTFEYAGDDETTRYMLFMHKSSLEETIEFLRQVQVIWEQSSPQYYEYAVLLKGVHIGGVSLYREHDEHGEYGELGWVINKKYSSNGYITEAAAALLRFGLKLGITRIIACCDSRNIPSQRVMQKLGMVLYSDDGFRVYPATGESAPELRYVYKESGA